MKFKYSWLAILFTGLVACDINNDLDPILDNTPAPPRVVLTAGSADFSNYIAVGASFSAGFTDGALFKAGQKNSFPNIMSSKFAMANGEAFTQPLMNDNTGGMSSSGQVVLNPRFYFNGKVPTLLNKLPSTIVGVPAKNAPNFKNYGIPGAKSIHFLAPGYGNPAGLATVPRTANPYFVRMNPTQPTLIAEIASKQPTFFSLSEIGGNDLLDYAIAGGIDPTAITPKATFDTVFNAIVNTLTQVPNAKGVVANLPYVTSFPYFTTVPHAPLDPTNLEFASQIPTLNIVYGALNQIYADPAINQPNRIVQFSTKKASPVVIKDKNLADLSATISSVLGNPNNTAFIGFIQSLGLPAQAAPLVAQLLGQQYGQARPATSEDLLVLPSSSIIGTVNKDAAEALMNVNPLITETLANQFSTEGITLPLADKWVLTKEEAEIVKQATDNYNETIKNVSEAKELAFVDFNALLKQAATNGIAFDNYILTTEFVLGGLISLDGVHLTARGYALMANKMLEAIDNQYGSNFKEATDGLAKADDYPTNYSPTLK
ncbi:Probable lipoprotein precursor [Tenacibaculum maritimum]|uniref:G-D-S-L family lipolytic protein n=1 Tax=Tenacibaculum maritimum TaxID=107401 RepID=UPI0012E51474|nr:G-D-S-L family lipolytic protein [Tenacibaculum maritimum]CAA0216314.1 Probable lipoprotein precursor [Tenacibaculum maritimum]